MTPQSVLSRKAGNMSDEMEPVAQTPEFGDTPNIASEEALAETTQTSEKTSGVKKWPWAVVAGIALVAGVGGFAIGNATGGHGINVHTVGDHRGFDPDGDNWTGGMPGGKHGQGPGRMQGDGQPGQNGPLMGGQNMGPGQGQPGQMPMGPHCEDSTGQHAPVNADGSCPTGFTLDDKQMGPGAGLNAPAPTASGATS